MHETQTCYLGSYKLFGKMKNTPMHTCTHTHTQVVTTWNRKGPFNRADYKLQIQMLQDSKV